MREQNEFEITLPGLYPEVRIRTCSDVLQEWCDLDKKEKLKKEYIEKQKIRKGKIKRLIK